MSRIHDLFEIWYHERLGLQHLAMALEVSWVGVVNSAEVI